MPARPLSDQTIWEQSTPNCWARFRMRYPNPFFGSLDTHALFNPKRVAPTATLSSAPPGLTSKLCACSNLWKLGGESLTIASPKVTMSYITISPFHLLDLLLMTNNRSLTTELGSFSGLSQHFLIIFVIDRTPHFVLRPEKGGASAAGGAEINLVHISREDLFREERISERLPSDSDQINISTPQILLGPIDKILF